MIIKRSIYNQIISQISSVASETGGIIGEQNGIICKFVYDKGIKQDNIGLYYPNVNMLNNVLKHWDNTNINFCGIVHSHINNQPYLSGGDVEYIEKIFLNLPDTISELFFPLVVNNEFIAYKARKAIKGIQIFCDITEII